MYNKTPGSTLHVLKHGYEVYIPPKPEDTLIAGFNRKKTDQVFERTPLPEFWGERREEEKARRALQQQMVDEGKLKKVTHFDPVLEKFRKKEWDKRLHGYWFYNNGVATYLTGTHYYYLNWTRWDHVQNGGYPIFYQNQVDRFYFRKLCETDPRSLGYISIGPRGFGKSSEEIACIVERTTRGPRRRRAALQSKTEDDARDVLFNEKLVPMYNELPDFFQPENDHGTNPQKKLSFKRPAVRGKEAKNINWTDEDQLLNEIFWSGASEIDLDGTTLGDILNDEIGKTDPKKVADVWKRIKVNRQCVFRNFVKTGILRCTSTVEELDKGGQQCQEAWDASDPEMRTENGQTNSWLYKWAVTVIETDVRFADKHGVIDPERKVKLDGIDEPLDVLTYHLNERKSREHNHEDLADWCRKNPMDEKDFFIKKPGSTTFNTMAINAYKTRLMGHKKLWIRGNFRWKDEKRPFQCGVEFERDDQSGRWQISWFPDLEGDPFMHMQKTKVMNNVTFGKDHNGKIDITPHNNHLFNFGVDPIKDIKTHDPRASKMSGKIFMRFQPLIDKDKPVKDWTTFRFIGRYNHRPDDPEDAFRDIAMAMIYYGCWGNLESNITSFNTYLRQNGMDKFIMTSLNFEDDQMDTKKNKEDGIVATDYVRQEYINLIRKVIKDQFSSRLNFLPFVDDLDQLIEFDPAKWTKFDDVVSTGYALIGANAYWSESEFTPQDEETDLWFDEYDISGDEPILIEHPYDDLEEDFIPNRDKVTDDEIDREWQHLT